MVGADRSAAMLDYTREHDAVGAEFVVCDLRDMGRLGRFDLVTSFYFGYIHQPTLADVRACLDGLADTVAPGGTLALGVCNPLDIFSRIPYAEHFQHNPNPITFDGVIWSWTENVEKGWSYRQCVAPHIETIRSWFRERFERTQLFQDLAWGMQGPVLVCESPRHRTSRAARSGSDRAASVRAEASTFSDLLERLPPTDPERLMGAENWARILRMGASFPAAGLEEVRIDLPLHETGNESPVPKAGLSVPLRPGDYSARLCASALGSVLAPPARDTLLRLASRSLGLCDEDIGKLVLACDDNGLSGICLEAAKRGFDNAGLLARLLGRLADRPDRRDMRRSIERLLLWTEQDNEGRGTIGLAGLQLGGDAGYRLRIDGIAPAHVADALTFLRWPGDTGSVADVLADLPPVARIGLGVEVTPQDPAPGLCIELHPHRQGWRSPDRSAWRRLLDALAPAGVASAPGMLSALDAFHGSVALSAGGERWTLHYGGDHIALRFGPGGIWAEACIGLASGKEA